MRRWIAGLICVVAVLGAGGCAPRVQAYISPAAEPAIINDKLITGSATVLPVRRWLPENGEIRAVIVAVHGFNDYSNAFVVPGHYLSSYGIGVYAYDQRGFGDTEDRGIWAGEENLKTDLRQMVQAVRAEHPQVPLYLLGESMGGAVVITTLAEEDAPDVDGAILSAPAVWGRDAMPPLYRVLLWAGAHTVPWMEATGKNLDIIASDNFAMLRAMGRDPLIIKKTRLDAIYGIVGLMDEAYAEAPKLDVPLLLLYGMNDQVIPAKPIFTVADSLSTRYKLAYYPRGFHMLLRDLKSEVVMDDIRAWVEDTHAFLPSGYDLNWRQLIPLNEEVE